MGVQNRWVWFIELLVQFQALAWDVEFESVFWVDSIQCFEVIELGYLDAMVWGTSNDQRNLLQALERHIELRCLV